MSETSTSQPRFITVAWHDGRVRLLDQRRLPGEVVYWDCADYREVAEAIRTLAVRRAPHYSTVNRRLKRAEERNA